MLNYIKSELYRVVRTRTIYIFMGCCAALMITMNVLLWACGKYDANFPYNTIDFSFSMLSDGGFQIAFLLTIAISSILFDSEFKNRTINNSVSYGYSREILFVGKTIVTLIFSAICLVVVEGALIGTGCLLLEDAGSNALRTVLQGTVYCLPAFICGVCGAVALFYVTGSETKGIWMWIITFVVVPSIISLLGMKFEIFDVLRQWTVYNILGESMIDPVTEEICQAWQTESGMLRLILAGSIGSIVCICFGLLRVRKTEIK